MHGTCEIADETCHIEDRLGHLACRIETPFFYKFVSKMQSYSSEQNCNVVHLVGHLYSKSLSPDFILENGRNAS